MPIGNNDDPCSFSDEFHEGFQALLHFADHGPTWTPFPRSTALRSHYARFVQIMGRLLRPMAALAHSLKGEESGVYFADSTKLQVCHNKRIASHRVFRWAAKRGKTSMGWFFGLKLHLVVNHRAELMAVKITPGNCDDRKPLAAMVKGLKGKIYADKGYISDKLFKTLWETGLHILTSIRKNMKNYLMPLMDKLILRKRRIIETIIGVLKNMGLEHSRHRSIVNAFVHILACLVAYSLRPDKPKIGTIFYPA